MQLTKLFPSPDHVPEMHFYLPQETQDTPFLSHLVKLFKVFSILLLFFVYSIDSVLYGAAEPLQGALYKLSYDDDDDDSLMTRLVDNNNCSNTILSY